MSTKGMHEPTLPFYEQGIPELDRFQRLEVLELDPQGFLPVSKPEQVEVIGLLDVIGKSWGVSRHLAEVRRGQNTANSTDPEKAARKITRNYVDWALEAQQTGRELEELRVQLADINPELSLAEPDLRNDIGRIGLLKFMRFFDLATLRSTGKVETVGYDPQKVKNTEDNPGIVAHLEMGESSWRVGQVKRKLGLAQEDTKKRFLFWRPRLEEITKHSPKNLAAIAHDGLGKI